VSDARSVSPKTVRFGAGFLGHLSAQNGPDQLRRAAALCDEGNLDSFWVADQRWMRDVYVSLTDLACHTRRIQLGMRVTDPYVRHPGLTAVAVATLDEVSGGRAILGIGAGGSGFDQMGLTRDKPAVAVREAIELIRALWRGQEVDYHGEVVRWNHGKLAFTCRPDIPIVVAARGPRLLEVAGEVADGVIIATGISAQSVAWARERIRVGAQRAGRREEDVELLHMTYIAIDDQDPGWAREAVKAGIMGAVSGSHPTYDFLRASGLDVPTDLYAYLESGARDPARIVELIPDAMVDKLAIAGTAQECTAKLQVLLQAGIQHVLLAPVPTEPGDELEILRRFIDDCLPALRTSASHVSQESEAD
jgi:5,10-methylenetetrahydromethanopterin reductase